MADLKIMLTKHILTGIILRQEKREGAIIKNFIIPDTLMMYLKHSEKCTGILPLSITLNDCIMEKNYETLRITFNKPLTEIDKEFEEEKEMFGVESLKEFIDGYESSRFTQISETEAIITSEYNMNHIVDWIERFAEDMVFS